MITRSKFKRLKCNHNSNNTNNILNIFNTDDDILSMSTETTDNSDIMSLISNTSKSDGESDTETNSEELDDLSNKEYKNLQTNLYEILDGSFFDELTNSYSIKQLQSELSIIDAHILNNEVLRLKEGLCNKNLNIVNILNKNISDKNKIQILEKIYFIINSDILSPEYKKYIQELDELVSVLNSKEYDELSIVEKNITNHLDIASISNSYKTQILQSKMGFQNQLIAYKYLQIMESYGENTSSEEHIKYNTWLNTLLKIPFNKYYEINIDYNCLKSIKKYISNIRNKLDENLSFLEIPKDQIINIISQLLKNPKSKINSIGLYGNKGLGKTQFVECVANALGRPLIRISLGGNSDANSLKGHNFTYLGSKQGQLVDAIISSKVMNPVIFFDEIDKLSNTEHGKEIVGTLIHLIDLTTNNKYNGDEYFSGIEFDLSRVLFMFTYNDPTKIDPILADRLYKIKINNYSIDEKIDITKKHIINNILKDFNYSNENISFTDDAITHIVESSKYSEGMRPIKSKIHTIISRINTLLLTKTKKKQKKIIKLKYNELYNVYKELPIKILKKHINILLDQSTTTDIVDDNNNYLNMYL